MFPYIFNTYFFQDHYFYFTWYFIKCVFSCIHSTQCILGFPLNNVHNNNIKYIIVGSYHAFINIYIYICG